MLTEKEKDTIDFFYKDLLKIGNLYLEKANSIKGKDTYKLVKEGKRKEAMLVVYIGDQTGLLLKFLYIYGTIFFNRAFKIIESKISKKAQNHFRFGEFQKNHFEKLKISEDLKQKIYCFIVYRNKFVEHHDFERSGGRLSFKDQVSQMRLSPLGKGFFEGGWEDNYKKLEILAKKHNLAGDMAINIVIPRLFNEVSYKHSDRTDIEKLAEEMGCVSYAFAEVTKLFKDFMEELKSNYY